MKNPMYLLALIINLLSLNIATAAGMPITSDGSPIVSEGAHAENVNIDNLCRGHKGKSSLDCIKEIVDLEIKDKNLSDEVLTRGASDKFMAGVKGVNFYIQLLHSINIVDECTDKLCNDEKADKACGGNISCINTVKDMISVLKSSEYRETK